MHGYCGYINRDDEKQLEFEWKFTTIGGGVETQYFASPRSRIEPNPNPNPEPQPMPGDAKYCVSTLPHRTRIHTRYRIQPEPEPNPT